MALISASTLQALRRIDESAMPSTCRILRKTKTQSPTSGLVIEGAATQVGSSVPCRAVSDRRVTDREKVVGMQTRRAELTALVYLPLGTNVRAEDFVEVSSTVAPDSSTVTYKVLGYDPDPDSYSTSLVIPALAVN
jgi:hypothetical protein